MRHCTLVAGVLAALLAGVGKAGPALQLAVSNQSAPPGGVVQVKVFATTPTPIALGQALVSFDPSIFGPIESVAVFSASGDAFASFTNFAPTLGFYFDSPSGGVGRLPGLPVLTVTIPILPTAVPGTKAQIVLDTAGPWTEANGNIYPVQCIPGTISVGGSLSIGNVTPGGGVQPAGTVVRVTGSGIDPAATLSVAGVSVRSTRVVSAQNIDFTLQAPAELTGKPVRVQNPDGTAVEYFPSFLPVPADRTTQELLGPGWIVFPLRAWTSATSAASGENVAYQNPSAAPIDVSVDDLEGHTYQFTVPAGAILLDSPVPDLESREIIASAPIQILSYTLATPPSEPSAIGAFSMSLPQALPPAAPPAERFRFPHRTENPSALVSTPKATQPDQGPSPIEFAPPGLIITYGVYGPPAPLPEVPEPDIGIVGNPSGASLAIQTSGPILVGAHGALVTPLTLEVESLATRPGIYEAGITATSGGATAPLRIEVTAGPIPPPVVGAVVDAGTQEIGAILSGQTVTIFGDLIGPPTGQEFRFARSGTPATELGNTGVTFDGIEAPILYASESQLNVIVPYGLPNPDFTVVRVSYFDISSIEVGIPLASGMR